MQWPLLRPGMVSRPSVSHAFFASGVLQHGEISMKILFPMIAAAVMLIAAPVQAAIYSVNDAFVAGNASNPNVQASGTYSYGYTSDATDVSQFSSAGLTYTTSWAGASGLNGYFLNTPEIVPAVVGNVTGSNITTFFGVTVKPGELLLHPGGTDLNSAYNAPIMSAVVRFTAAVASNYSVSGMFEHLHNGLADIHVYVNGVSVFDGINSGSFGGNYFVGAGQHIDFVVGDGGNGIGSDSTGLFADIHATPEPATLAIWGGIGLCGLVAGYRRKRLARS